MNLPISPPSDRSPLVSVIVPTFNRPEQLLEAIQSIEAQTFRRFEIIVVNDAGVDVRPLLQSRIEAGHLRYFLHSQNKGLAATRNTGLREARGQYIAYLDDDDILYPQHLKTLLTAFRDPACFVAYADSYQAEQIVENGVLTTVSRNVLFRDEFNADRLLVQNYIPVQCIMHRRECLDTCGYFDETFRSHEDLEMWLRYSRLYAFVHIGQFTSEFRTRLNEGLSASKARMIESLRQVYRKHPVDPDALPLIWRHRHLHLDTLVANELIGRPALLASIVVCFHDDWEQTVQCLNSLFENSTQGLYEIVLIDNGSSDGSKNLASRTPGLLHYIRNEREIGVATALNQGARVARGRYAVFLDPGARVGKDWLEYLIAAAENDERIGAVGSKVLRPDGKMESAGAMVFRDGDRLLFGGGADPAQSIYSLPVEADYCPRTSLLVRKSVFDETGGFDEGCSPFYDDADLCFAIRRAGYKVVYQPLSLLVREPGGTAAPGDLEKNKSFFQGKWREELVLLLPPPRLAGGLSLSPSRRPDKISVLLGKAAEDTLQGRDRAAVHALRHAIELDFQRVQDHCLRHESVGLRQNYLLAGIGSTPGDLPRPFYLLQECALLGRFHPALTPTQRKTIHGLLDIHEEKWRSRELPADSRVYETAAALPTMPAATVALLAPKYLHCRPTYTDMIDNDVTYHFGKSASEAGLRVEHFPADELVSHGCDNLPEVLARLDSFLGAVRPAIVVMFCDFMPNGRTIDPEVLASLRKKHGFQILFVIPAYDYNPANWLAYWGPMADLCLIYHRYSMQYDNFVDKHKIMICPGVPYSEATFGGCHGGERDLNLTYVGNDSRFRGLFVNVARLCGLPIYSRIHNRERSVAPDLDEYVSILGRSKVIFNNGWRPRGDSVLTARFFESILSGALVLQETGTCVDDLFVPFIHYVPVANLHQFVIFSQFFLEEEERRAKICREAYRFMVDHYSSAQFWKVIVMRMLKRKEESSPA